MEDQPRAARQQHPSRRLPTARLEAFSDGVFAIAVTLLVLDLKVPESPERLLAQLFAEWPSLLGYLVSFAFISASWVAHAGLTHLLRSADGVFLGMNLLLLLFVSFLPFTTSLFTKHLTDSGERVAVVAFGLNPTLAGAGTLDVCVADLAVDGDERGPSEDRSDFLPGRIGTPDHPAALAAAPVGPRASAPLNCSAPGELRWI